LIFKITFILKYQGFDFLKMYYNPVQ